MFVSYNWRPLDGLFRTGEGKGCRIPASRVAGGEGKVGKKLEEVGENLMVVLVGAEAAGDGLPARNRGGGTGSFSSGELRWSWVVEVGLVSFTGARRS